MWRYASAARRRRRAAPARPRGSRSRRRRARWGSFQELLRSRKRGLVAAQDLTGDAPHFVEVRRDVLFVHLEDRRPDADVALSEAEEGAQPAADEAAIDAGVLQVRRECSREKLRQVTGERNRAVVIVGDDALEPPPARRHELGDE